MRLFERYTAFLKSAEGAEIRELGHGHPLQSSVLHLARPDEAAISEFYEKLRQICRLAEHQGVRIVFDAEQSWYQPALDSIVTSLAKEFNRSDVPVIYNTYQTNLKETKSHILKDLAQSKREGTSFGGAAILQRLITTVQATP